MDEGFPWDRWQCQSCVYYFKRAPHHTNGECRKNPPVKHENWPQTGDQNGCGAFYSRKDWWDAMSNPQKEPEEEASQ